MGNPCHKRNNFKGYCPWLNEFSHRILTVLLSICNRNEKLINLTCDTCHLELNYKARFTCEK